MRLLDNLLMFIGTCIQSKIPFGCNIPKAFNHSRGEHISDDKLTYDLRERHALWETKFLQHCVVAEYFDEQIAGHQKTMPMGVRHKLLIYSFTGSEK